MSAGMAGREGLQHAGSHKHLSCMMAGLLAIMFIRQACVLSFA